MILICEKTSKSKLLHHEILYQNLRIYGKDTYTYVQFGTSKT